MIVEAASSGFLQQEITSAQHLISFLLFPYQMASHESAMSLSYSMLRFGLNEQQNGPEKTGIQALMER